MCDTAAVGEICTSPTAVAFLGRISARPTAARASPCLYGNYSGDNMNVKMAVRMAKKEGIDVKNGRRKRRCPPPPRRIRRDKRRGVAGEVFSCGRSAVPRQQPAPIFGRSRRRGAKGNRQYPQCRHRPHSLLRSLRSGIQILKIEEGTMEVGIGHHGEPGIEVCELEDRSANGRPYDRNRP